MKDDPGLVRAEHQSNGGEDELGKTRLVQAMAATCRKPALSLSQRLDLSDWRRLPVKPY